MKVDLHGRYHFLCESEIHMVNEKSLKILSDIGVQFQNDKILKLLNNLGCKVDYDTQTAKIPADVVNFCLDVTRKNSTGKNEKNKIRSDYNDKLNIYGTVSGFAVRALDRHTGVARSALLNDLYESIRIANHYDCIKSCSPLFRPQDVTTGIEDLYEMAACLKYSKKPFFIEKESVRNLEYLFKMAMIVFNDEQLVRQKGFVDYHCCSSSPLRFPAETLEITLKSIELGGKVSCGVPMVVMGATAPVTLAGAISLANAEMLAGIVLGCCIGSIQETFFYSIIPTDQRTGAPCYADPRKLAACGSSLDMAQYYGMVPGGFHVDLDFHIGMDAAVPGIQAAAERMFGTMLGLFLADSQPSIRIGILGPAGNCASVAQMVIDIELCSMLNAYLRGIKVDDEHLAYDVIEKVGIGGNYIMEDHTFDHYKEELWFPELFERRDPMIDSEVVIETVYKKANTKVDEILAGEAEMLITREQAEEIDAILISAEKDILCK